MKDKRPRYDVRARYTLIYDDGQVIGAIHNAEDIAALLPLRATTGNSEAKRVVHCSCGCEIK
jgi:hypothetical protein